MHPTLATLRFLRSWARHGRPGGPESETVSDTGRRHVRVEPDGAGPHPGWVVLHGMTRPGPDHAGLVRFRNALAAAGVRVLVPEIREWQALDFAPQAAGEAIREAVRTLADEPGTRGPVVLAGFSFGGPQALRIATEPETGSRLAAVISWGGYHRLASSVRFSFEGSTGAATPPPGLTPDAYGRWIVGANHLGNALPGSDPGSDPGSHPGSHPGVESAAGPADNAAAAILHELAALAGDLQVPVEDPAVATLAEQRFEAASPETRRLLALFGVPPGRGPNPHGLPGPTSPEALELSRELVEAALTREPLLEPFPLESPVRVPVHLLHGRDDRMIPFTETLALAEALRQAGHAPAGLHVGITGLYAHSGGTEGAGAGALWRTAREGLHFARLLHRLFRHG